MDLPTGLEVILNEWEIKDAFHNRGWGRTNTELTKEQGEYIIQALQQGKCLALDDGEYTHCIYIKDKS